LQSYNNNYTYQSVNAPSNSFAPVSANNGNIAFEFGINGSLRKRTDTNKTEYYLFNGFEQMKAYSDNGETYGYYGYDDAGQRMYKVLLKATELYNNRLGGKMLDVDKIMLYPNGYINIDQNGNYTKHYYADAARVASKIGSGSEKLISCATDSSQSVYAFEIMKKELSELTGDTIDNIVYQLDTLQYFHGDSGNDESDLYFYHGNHLSSTQMITDMQDDVTQAVLYTPHGQVISEYREDWKLDTLPRYLFNAKELDDESGLYYYEARYYDPKGTFTSRDPLFEKFFWMSPYAYCANNPVKYIDPDGNVVRTVNEKATDAFINYLVQFSGVKEEKGIGNAFLLAKSTGNYINVFRTDAKSFKVFSKNFKAETGKKLNKEDKKTLRGIYNALKSSKTIEIAFLYAGARSSSDGGSTTVQGGSTPQGGSEYQSISNTLGTSNRNANWNNFLDKVNIKNKDAWDSDTFGKEFDKASNGKDYVSFPDKGENKLGSFLMNANRHGEDKEKQSEIITKILSTVPAEK